MDELGLLAPPPLAPRMAASADRIAILTKEIPKQAKILADLKKELLLLTDIPPYLAHVIKVLVAHFGENPEWINTITEAIKKNLNSIPQYTFDYHDRRICSYVWNDEHIEYYIHWNDDTDVLCKHSCGYTIRTNCIYTYKEKKWENFKEFNLENIPILIGYMIGKLYGINNIKGVYEAKEGY